MPCMPVGHAARELIARGFNMVGVGSDTQWVRVAARFELDKALEGRTGTSLESPHREGGTY